MLLKFTVLACVLAHTTAILPVPATFPRYCSECADEVWEEVPCDLIPTTSPTTTTTEPPIITDIPPVTLSLPTTTSTAAPLTPAYTFLVDPIPNTTTAAPVTTTPSTVAPYLLPTVAPYILPTAAPYILPTAAPYNPPLTTTTAAPATTTEATGSEAFKKCYCECKVGCTDFCRKVVLNPDPKQQITQITKTSESVNNGAVEVTHLHERKYLSGGGGAPGSYSSSSSSSSSYSSARGYEQPQPATCPRPLPPTIPPPKLPGYPVEASLEIDGLYDSPKHIYNAPPLPAVTNYAPPTNYYSAGSDTGGYSIDELTQLLQSEGFGKASYTNPSQIYYSQASAPSYPYGLVPAALNKPYNPVAPVPIEQYALPPNPNPTPVPTPVPTPTPNPQTRYSELPAYDVTAAVPAPSPNYVPKSDSPAYEPSSNGPAFDYAVDRYMKNYVYANPNQKPSAPDGYAPYQETSYSITYK